MRLRPAFGVTGWLTREAHKKSSGRLTAPVRKFGLGAFVLLLLTAAFAIDEVQGGKLWMGIMSLGTVYVVYEIVRKAVARLCAGRAVA